MNQPTKTNGARPTLKRGVSHSISSDPFLDWVIILAVALIVAVALVVSGISMYVETKDALDSRAAAQPKNLALPIDQATLDKVLKAFEDNATERATIMKSYVAPRDPSPS